MVKPRWMTADRFCWFHKVLCLTQWHSSTQRNYLNVVRELNRGLWGCAETKNFKTINIKPSRDPFLLNVGLLRLNSYIKYEYRFLNPDQQIWIPFPGENLFNKQHQSGFIRACALLLVNRCVVHSTGYCTNQALGEDACIHVFAQAMKQTCFSPRVQHPVILHSFTGKSKTQGKSGRLNYNRG